MALVYIFASEGLWFGVFHIEAISDMTLMNQDGKKKVLVLDLNLLWIFSYFGDPVGSKFLHHDGFKENEWWMGRHHLLVLQ